jgi:hypothetical protein
MSHPATLTDLRLRVQGTIAKIGRGFTKPDDDWAMVLVVQTPRGVEPALVQMPLGGAEKEAVGEALRQLVALQGAYRYALVLNMHRISQDELSEEQLAAVRGESLRLEQIEASVEGLLLLVGDAETEEAWSADITRNARGVRQHGPWEQMDYGSQSGRFAGLNEYMRRPR